MSHYLIYQKRIAGRDDLLIKAVNTFAAHHAAAVHQFGSLARGRGDALSDVDLWITFPDDQLPGVIHRRESMYNDIAEVLITHEALQNSPLGGRYSLVIHGAIAGLYHVDYYLAPQSKSIILPEATVLYGDDSLPRGAWLLNQAATTPESLPERVAFLVCMAFIGVKKVLRRDASFMDFLVTQYRRFIGEYQLGLEAIESGLDLATIERLLHQLSLVADPRQRRAIEEIVQRYLPLGYDFERR